MSGVAIGRDALRRVRRGSAALVTSAFRWGAFFAVALAATVATAAPVWSSGSYTPSAWTPGSNNLLSGATADASGLTRFDEGNSSHSISTLTDGEVPGSTYDKSKVFGIRSGSAVWTFQKADIEQIRVFTRWADGGRDAVNISSVAMRYDGSEEWTDIGASAVSYGNGNVSGSGAMYAILKNSAGAALAVGVTGLRLYFGTQENNGAGYAEIEAIAYDESIRWDAGAWTTWTAGSHNVLNGLSPSESSEVHVGNVESGQLGSAEKLTDGAVPSQRAGKYGEFCDIHSGAVLVYQLASAVDISEFRFCTFWDSGRNRIDIAGIDYSTDGGNNWTTIPNSAIGYFESSSSSTRDRASFAASDGSAIASGANAVRFRFGSQENGWVAYCEIEALPTIYYKSGVFAEGSSDLKVVTRDGEGNETEIELSSGDNVVFDDAVAGANATVYFGETLPTGVTYSFSDNWTGTVLPQGVDTATTYIWTGVNGDGNMNTDGNWYGNAAPSTGAAVYIPAAKTVTIVNNIENFAPASITFGSGSGQVTIGGNAITGVAAITNHSSAIQTFNVPVSGNAIDIYTNSTHCAFRGGITLGSATFGGAATDDARALVGSWKFTGGDGYTWTPVANNRVMDNSSVTVEGQLLNPSSLVIDSGCVVTAATLKATHNVKSALINTDNGCLVVTGECRLETNADCYLAAPADDSKENNATVEFDSYYGKPNGGWPRINAKTVIVGAGGITCAQNNVYFAGCPVLYSKTGRFSLDSKSSGKFIGATTGVEINTTQYGTGNVPATITVNAEYGKWNDNDKRGAMKVTGCGTVLFNSKSTFTGGLTVSDTATVAVNPGKQPGAGTVTVNNGATLQVAQSGTVALGGGLTLADGAALGFNFTGKQTAPVLNVTGKTVTLNGNKNVTVKVSAADGIRPKGDSYVLTSGGKFADATVSLASGAPDWVKGVSVADGEIVLDVKSRGFMLIVK